MHYIGWTIVTLLYFFLLRAILAVNYDLKLLKKVRIKADQDIWEGRDWVWRYELYARVSPPQIIFQFWKSIKSFRNEEELLGHSPKIKHI